jgi:predicted RNA-binding Zn ribbon-like protein
VTSDPRPLTGEPLAIDLLNTAWIEGGEHRDLLHEPGGIAAWGHAGADPVALGEARAAIRAALAGDWAPLNAVLAHGRIALSGGPDAIERVEVDEERWRLPWLAARNLLRLDPGRVRACSGHECVLHFYDTSKAGRRQWCSMAGCGNRAKARRHYERSRLRG